MKELLPGLNVVVAWVDGPVYGGHDPWEVQSTRQVSWSTSKQVPLGQCIGNQLKPLAQMRYPSQSSGLGIIVPIMHSSGG